MRRVLLAALAAACSLVVSCAGGSATEGAGAEAEREGERVPVETVLATTASCHGDFRDESVISDAETWRAWWDVTSCGRSGPPPRVDFSARLVLAVRDELGPTACYDARIVEVRRRADGGYFVLAEHAVPDRETPCVASPVHAAHAVTAPRARGPFEFEWRVGRAPAPGEGLR